MEVSTIIFSDLVPTYIIFYDGRGNMNRVTYSKPTYLFETLQIIVGHEQDVEEVVRVDLVDSGHAGAGLDGSYDVIAGSGLGGGEEVPGGFGRQRLEDELDLEDAGGEGDGGEAVGVGEEGVKAEAEEEGDDGGLVELHGQVEGGVAGDGQLRAKLRVWNNLC